MQAVTNQPPSNAKPSLPKGLLDLFAAQQNCLTLGAYFQWCVETYYQTQNPFGVHGDFTTAPEISGLFGEMIGAWLVHTWGKLGSPKKFALVELGPGRGTLMADILRTTKLCPAFLEAAEIHLVETSPRLKEEQAATLQNYTPTWHDRLDTLPVEMPLVMVANEFFDALPVEQYRMAEGILEQHMVRYDAARGVMELVFLPVVPSHVVPHPHPLPRGEGVRAVQCRDSLSPRERVGVRDCLYGSIVEISPIRTAVFGTLCTRLKQQGGTILIIDYGYTALPFGDTVQAMQNHQYSSILDNAGEADITAHVDFTALKQQAEIHQLTTTITSQKDFLLQCGIMQRLAALSPQSRQRETSGVERLIGAMGELFKVLMVE